MKYSRMTSALLLSLALTACVTIEVPHLVADTAAVGKSAYDALHAKKEAKKREQASNAMSHSYVGNKRQTTAEIKQQCEVEGAAKLRQVGGGEQVAYTVLTNEIVSINGAIAANCKLALAR